MRFQTKTQETQILDRKTIFSSSKKSCKFSWSFSLENVSDRNQKRRLCGDSVWFVYSRWPKCGRELLSYNPAKDERKI